MGLFSGWDEKKQYSPETWLYEGSEQKRHPSQPAPGHHPADGGHAKDRGGEAGPGLAADFFGRIDAFGLTRRQAPAFGAAVAYCRQLTSVSG